jgi:hypothetical protein
MLVEPDRSPAPAAVVAAPGLPTGWLALLWFGMQQPLIGLRVVLREPGLRRIAARADRVLVVVCLLVATSEGDVGRRDRAVLRDDAEPRGGPGGAVRRHLQAPRRGGARPLGLSPREAARPSLGSAIGNAIRQMILVAIGLVPVYLFVEFMAEWAGVDGLFVALAWLLGALWTLHWISDRGPRQRADPGRGGLEVDAQRAIDAAGDPWFVRLYGGPLRPFGGLLRRLSRPWRRELEVLARAPRWSSASGSASPAAAHPAGRAGVSTRGDRRRACTCSAASSGRGRRAPVQRDLEVGWRAVVGGSGEMPGADVDLQARVEELRRVELRVARLTERDEVGLAAVRRQLDVVLALGADRRFEGQRAPAGHVVVADEHPRRVRQAVQARGDRAVQGRPRCRAGSRSGRSRSPA